MTGRLRKGARFEVQRCGRWVVARVVDAYTVVDGAGTLFPGEPVEVFTVETVAADGTRGDVFTMRGEHPIRLLEAGLFAE